MKQLPNLWAMSLDQIRLIPFGSKVMAGSYGGEGTFLGVNKNGVVVVAWDDTVARLGQSVIPKLVQYAFS
jgi:hypothetical protein